MTRSTDARVRRPKDKDQIMSVLADNVFGTYWEVMVFAASLGYSHKRRVTFTEVSEPVRFSTFANNGLEYFPNLLALATEKEASILADSKFEERLKMFEEYANGGLEILGSALDAHSVVLDAVITEITKVRTRIASDFSGHEDIEDLISE